MDKRKKERRVCGTCRWYDPLLDKCPLGLSAREWLTRKGGCGKWESEDDAAERGL